MTPPHAQQLAHALHELLDHVGADAVRIANQHRLSSSELLDALRVRLNMDDLNQTSTHAAMIDYGGPR